MGRLKLSSQSSKKEKNEKERRKSTLQDWWDIIKFHIMKFEEKKESLFKAILAENFPVYRENNGHPDLWGQKDPYQLKHNRAIPKCIIINVSKVVHKGRILKAAGKKKSQARELT